LITLVQNVELEKVVGLAEEIARQQHQDGAGVATATPTVEPGLGMDGESMSRGYRIWSQRRQSWPLGEINVATANHAGSLSKRHLCFCAAIFIISNHG
jgi:hypothetical protein